MARAVGEQGDEMHPGSSTGSAKQPEYMGVLGCRQGQGRLGWAVGPGLKWGGDLLENKLFTGWGVQGEL